MIRVLLDIKEQRTRKVLSQVPRVRVDCRRDADRRQRRVKEDEVFSGRWTGLLKPGRQPRGRDEWILLRHAIQLTANLRARADSTWLRLLKEEHGAYRAAVALRSLPLVSRIISNPRIVSRADAER